MGQCGPPMELQGEKGRSGQVGVERVIRVTGAGWGGVVVSPRRVYIYKVCGGEGQDCFSRFLGRPKGGHWAEASALKASATR